MFPLFSLQCAPPHSDRFPLLDERELIASTSLGFGITNSQTELRIHVVTSKRASSSVRNKEFLNLLRHQCLKTSKLWKPFRNNNRDWETHREHVHECDSFFFDTEKIKVSVSTTRDHLCAPFTSLKREPSVPGAPGQRETMRNTICATTPQHPSLENVRHAENHPPTLARPPQVSHPHGGQPKWYQLHCGLPQWPQIPTLEHVDR